MRIRSLRLINVGILDSFKAELDAVSNKYVVLECKIGAKAMKSNILAWLLYIGANPYIYFRSYRTGDKLAELTELKATSNLNQTTKHKSSFRIEVETVAMFTRVTQ